MSSLNTYIPLISSFNPKKHEIALIFICKKFNSLTADFTIKK